MRHRRPRVPIIDENPAGYQYKKMGFGNYKDLASMSTNHKIRENSFTNQGLALELNLGFPSHCEYLKSIASAASSKRTHLLLFFSDSLDFCLDRAERRFASGGREVKPEIVTEMYH